MSPADSSGEPAVGDATLSGGGAPAGVLAALAALTAGALGLAIGGGSLPESALLAGYALLFAPYLALLWLARDAELPLWPIVVAGVAVRVVLLPAEPLLSDDIFRYVWDGRVTLAGINPFEHAPAADALAHLRDEHVWPKINHAEVPTIYPPGAQYLFAANAAVGGGVIGMKALFVLVEATAIGALGRWLARLDEAPAIDPAFALAVYALNPLVFVEIAWSGHLDVVAWGLLAVGLVVWRYGGRSRAALVASLAVGASIAVKFLGLLAVPLLAAERGSRLAERLPLRRRLAALAAAPIVVLVAYLPFLGAGPKLFAGFGTYAESWRGNDGGYRAVHALAETSLRHRASETRTGPGGEQVLFRFERLNGLYRSLGWTREWRGETIADTTYSAGELAAIFAKATAMFVVGLVMLWCLIARLRPAAGLLAVLLALYLFAPVVHPWYVAWLVPLAALTRAKTPLVFSFTCLAAYLAWLSAESGGPWHVPDWAVAAEYGAVVLTALWELTRDPR